MMNNLGNSDYFENTEITSNLPSQDEIRPFTEDELKQFFFKRQFQHHKFAQYMLNTYKIKRINGHLHIFDGKVYVGGYNVIENRMVKHIPFLTDSKRKEVIKLLEILCLQDYSIIDYCDYIPFNNGVYDIKSDKLLPHSDKLIITNLIPHNYNKMAYSEPIDNVLSKLSCYDEDIKALLIEAIGYSFYRRNELSASFFLVGDKANGKSTYLTMIEALLGQSNTTSLGLEDLTERFYKVMLVGKLACNGDDISDNALRGKPLSEFKKLVSGNSTLAENKGKDAFTHKPYCKFFFSCNNPPDLYDPTGAVMRRIVYIPMRAKFTKQDKDYDPYIISKLTSEKSMEYLIQLALVGLKRVLKNNGFTSSHLSEEAKNQYEEQNNSVLSFINEKYLEEGESPFSIFFMKSINEIYDEYFDYCSTNRIEAETRTKFTRTICIRYNMKSHVKKKDGKSLRCFVPI